MPFTKNFYDRFFSISEIRNSKVLQLGLGALLLGYFTSFYRAPASLTKAAAERFEHVCPPYFQSCGDFYFFDTLPVAYTQTLFYMVLFGFMILAGYFMFKREWRLVHACMLPLFVWHLLQTFVLSYQHQGNYEFYVAIFGFTLLLFPHKEFFTKLLIVLLYFFSTFTKIHPAWVLGTYFSSLHNGLPLFPEWSTPIWTNALIGIEMVGVWFLMSKNPILQRSMLAIIVFFHLYSGILVSFRYPSNILPMVLIMFGPLYTVTKVPLDRRALAGFALVAFCLVGQVSSHLIKGDEKLTQEGLKYGVYMFDSNHQCQNYAEVRYNDGRPNSTIVFNSHKPRERCDVYREWFKYKQICKIDQVASIGWKFDHSINGAPFLRIVDEENMCDLEYRPFRHDEWIKSYKDKPQIIARPVENGYY